MLLMLSFHRKTKSNTKIAHYDGVPKHFKVKKGGRKDVLVGSDSEAEDSEDEHNKAVLDDDCSSSGGVGEHGDN